MGQTLLRLVLAQSFLHAAMAGTRMAAPLLMLREGVSAASVGVLLAFFGLTQVFLAVPAGRFADRRGLQAPIRLSILMACAGAAMAALWPAYGVLCLAALLTGGAAGLMVIALQRHVGRIAEGGAQLRQVFSWLAIGPAASNVLGPLTAGLLIDHAGPEAGSRLGFQAAFALMADFPLVTWLLVRRVAEAPGHQDRQDLQSQRSAPGVGQAPLRAWHLLRDKGFSRLMLVNWVISSSWDVHTLVVPLIAVERGISASVIGTILGGFALAATAIRLLMPLLASRIREWAVMAAAMLLTAVLFAVYPLMPGPWGMGVCSVLLGAALGAVQPMVMSTLHQITPSERHGEALGLRLMAVTASSVAMPVLFGSASALVGAAGVFWIVGAAVGLGSRSAWALRRALDEQRTGHAPASHHRA